MKRILIVNEFTSDNSNSTGYLFHLLRQEISDVCKITELNLEEVTKYKKSNIIKFLFLFGRLVKERKLYDTIILGTNPPFLIFFIFLIKYKVKVNVYLYLMDLFPQNLVIARYLHKGSFVYRILLWLTVTCLKRYDQIMVLGQDMKELLLAQSIEESKILYYPIIIPILETETISKDEDKNEILIQFFGNIGPLQNLKEVIQHFNLSNLNGYKLEIIGDGRNASEVDHLVKNFSNSKITYHKGIPMAERSLYLSRTNIALVCLAKGSRGIAVPSKAFFNFAVGIPVIAIVDEGSELCNLVNMYDLGVVVSDFNNNNLDKTLESILTNYAVRYSKAEVKVRYESYIIDAKVTRKQLLKCLKGN